MERIQRRAEHGLDFQVQQNQGLTILNCAIVRAKGSLTRHSAR